MPFQEEFVDIRGSKIQMLKGGVGSSLLYLHSAGGEVAWLLFFELLSQHFEKPEETVKLLVEFFGNSSVIRGRSVPAS